jgi:hypothetical protein
MKSVIHKREYSLFSSALSRALGVALAPDRDDSQLAEILYEQGGPGIWPTLFI